jgi:hypothetical protein
MAVIAQNMSHGDPMASSLPNTTQHPAPARMHVSSAILSPPTGFPEPFRCADPWHPLPRHLP